MDQILGTLVSGYVLLDGVGLCLPGINSKSTVEYSEDNSYCKEPKEFNYRPVNIEDHSIDKKQANVLVPILSEISVYALLELLWHLVASK